MKTTGIKKINTVVYLCFAIIGMIAVNGCKESKLIAEKNGMTLWGENCQRCHFAPASNAFSAEEWKTVGLHMQSRALLTNKERDKIIDFLQN